MVTNIAEKFKNLNTAAKRSLQRRNRERVEKQQLMQKMRKMDNIEEQGKEFGEILDMRASNPMHIRTFLSKNKGMDRENQSNKLMKLNENYFYKNIRQTGRGRFSNMQLP